MFRNQEVEAEDHNGKERWLNAAWLFVSGGLVWVVCFLHKPSVGLQRWVEKEKREEKVSSEQQLSRGKYQRWEENGQAALSSCYKWLSVTQIITCNNQGMQKSMSECTTWDHSRCHSFQLRTGKWDYKTVSMVSQIWKNIGWSDDLRILLRCSDSKLRIWCK